MAWHLSVSGRAGSAVTDSSRCGCTSGPSPKSASVACPAEVCAGKIRVRSGHQYLKHAVRLVDAHMFFFFFSSLGSIIIRGTGRPQVPNHIKKRNKLLLMRRELGCSLDGQSRSQSHSGTAEDRSHAHATHVATRGRHIRSSTTRGGTGVKEIAWLPRHQLTSRRS